MKNVLLTFTGFHDPFWKDAIDGVDQVGPVLTAVAARPFAVVYLFATPNTLQNTTGTAVAIAGRHPAVHVETAALDLPDPTDYRAILRGLRREFAEIQREQPDARYYIATASGTPHMHAAWLLLAASGEIPATLLQTKPPRFLAAGEASALDVDLTAAEFPVVRPQIFANSAIEDRGVDLHVLTRQLRIVGDDPAFVTALETAVTLGQYESPVLITGESGTGKEKIAELVHSSGARAGRKMRIVNCAAIPAHLAESTLFGHVKGAFTGATNDKAGEFTLASKSSLFLDEFAELPLETQAKLLRAIENKEVCPVGATQTSKVDVQIIVATNKDLKQAIADGKFREDLFYRIDIGRIVLPPLRQRRDDIVKLAVFFVDLFGSEIKQRRTITPEALTRLAAYSWPGNVRQLANVIRRAVYFCRDGQITAEALEIEPSDEPRTLPDPHEGFSLPEYVDKVRMRLIDRAVELSKGNQTAASKLLGITQQAVSEALRKRFTS